MKLPRLRLRHGDTSSNCDDDASYVHIAALTHIARSRETLAAAVADNVEVHTLTAELRTLRLRNHFKAMIRTATEKVGL